MKISLILGTYGSRLNEMERLFDSLENQTYKNFELIVGTQTNFDELSELLSKYSFHHKVVYDDGIGCSSSRNRAKKYATGDIYNYSDDDAWYFDESLEKVANVFKESDSDAISFMHYDPVLGKSTIEYSKEPIESIAKLKSLKLASLDMWYRASSIDIQEHSFDERFGIGTRYNSGEENIFIMDLYKENKKISFIPEIVAYHPYKAVNYIDEKSFIAKGPLFKRLFGSFAGFALFLAFSMKKRSEVKQNNEGRFFSILFKALKEQLSFEL